MKTLFFTAAAVTLGFSAAAQAQDYPQAADMRPMGTQEGRYRPPEPQMSQRDVRKLCPSDNECIFWVNHSKHRITQMLYAVARDASTGQYFWSGKQLGPNNEFYNNKWIFIRRPKDMGCSIAFRIWMEYKGHTIWSEDEFNFCNDKASYIELKPPQLPSAPKRPCVYVESDPNGSQESTDAAQKRCTQSQSE